MFAKKEKGFGLGKSLLALVFFVLLIQNIFFDKNDSTKENEQITAKVSNEESVDDIEDVPLTLEETIEEAADPHFGEITDIEINEDVGRNDGGKIVLIHNKQDGLTKRTVDYNTTKALNKIFSLNQVNEITYFWEATLVDVNGNESVETVVKIQMNKETANKINWNNFLFKNLENVADQYNISPVVKEKL